MDVGMTIDKPVTRLDPKAVSSPNRHRDSSALACLPFPSAGTRVPSPIRRGPRHYVMHCPQNAPSSFPRRFCGRKAILVAWLCWRATPLTQDEARYLLRVQGSRTSIQRYKTLFPHPGQLSTLVLTCPTRWDVLVGASASPLSGDRCIMLTVPTRKSRT